MIFPIGDDQVVGGYKPIFSYAFIGINIIMFLIQVSTPGNLVCELSTIPNQIVNGEDWYTLISSMFMHGGWMHLIGNMLFLWVFADNIEATVGNFNFLAFYILGGLIASAAHIYFSTGVDAVNCCMPCYGSMPCDNGGQAVVACASHTPSLGASGAIAAVMGAYLVMFPKSKIKMFVIYFFSSFKIPAIMFLGFWIVTQLFSGIGSLGPSAQSSGVAWWAHIGGFVFGVLAGFFARDRARQVQLSNQSRPAPRPNESRPDDYV